MSLRNQPMAVIAFALATIAGAGLARAQPTPAEPNPYDAADPPRPRSVLKRTAPKTTAQGPEWGIFVGAWVEVIRKDGVVVRGRMWRISDYMIVVNLGQRSTVIPITQVASLRRLSQRPSRGQARAQRPLRTSPTVVRRAPLGTKPPSASTFHTEWITLFGFGGGGAFGFLDFEESDRYIVGGVELGLFSIVWRHAYFDILRLSGGYPYLFSLGTAFGFRGLLDAAQKYEMRLGLHITCPYYFMFMPAMSGLDIKLLVRTGKKFRIQLGLKVFAFPPAAAAGVGFSY